VTEVGVVKVRMHGAGAARRAWSLRGLELHGGRSQLAGAARAADMNWKL